AGGAVSASPGIPPLPHEERLWHDRLIRTCFVDYDRELALVAEVEDADAGERSIVAVGRLSRPPGAATAEFAMLVADRMQRRGIGTELVRRMLDVARAEGVARVVGRMLPSNVAVRAICHRLGFTVADSAPDLATASIDL
ncbi:MAG: N-acetyltransferase, partial [Chloroflexi bacterium CFX6]|nr:N-acetyltransferase [Chloroflexi bacterium CFX6]